VSSNQSGAWHRQQQSQQQQARDTAGFHFGQNGQPGFWAATDQHNGSGQRQGQGNGVAGGQGGGSHFILGEPEFNSVEDVRNYCNHVRALMTHAAIELAMASRILEARLAQAQALPGDSPVQARMRARKVGRKLKKAADGATAAAKSAVGAYGAFTREYADLMRPRPQRTATTNPFKF
jgi:hypothetical protein